MSESKHEDFIASLLRYLNEKGLEARIIEDAELAANVVVRNPGMLKDALRNTKELNED